MLETYVSLDGIRVFTVLFLSVLQVFAGSSLSLKRQVHKDLIKAEKVDTPLIPYGPFFSIWMLIFAGCLCFAILQAMPQNLTDPYFQKMGWVVTAILLGTSAWQIWSPKYGLGWGSLAIILFAFLHAVIGVRIITSYDTFDGQMFWIGQAPILLFAGWLSLVTFANLSATLTKAKTRFDPMSGMGGSMLILAAGFVVATIGFYSGSYLYIGAAIWGLIGIIVASFVKDRPKAISGASGVSIVMILAGVMAAG